MICPICKNEITKEDLKYILANDYPYLTLYCHRECYKSIDNIHDFIRANIDELIIYNRDKKPRKIV